MNVAALGQRGAALSVPDEIVSPTAKLVSLYLAVAGATTADELAEDLEMKKLSLLSVLRTLEGRDVVERDGDRYELV